MSVFSVIIFDLSTLSDIYRDFAINHNEHVYSLYHCELLDWVEIELNVRQRWMLT